MPDLSTTYMGLKLANPLVAGSSGNTATVTGVRAMEDAGVGAVVLKSIFEEEIDVEYRQAAADAERRGLSLASYDYYDYQVRGDRVAAYVELVREAKKAVRVPVIASVNCTWSHEWAAFARELQSAGADGLELNMYFLPSDMKRTSAEREADYFRIVEKVLAQVTIPVAVKIGTSFSTLAQVIERLSRTGVAALVLFNRFYAIDFDIEKLTVTGSHMLSTPDEIAAPLRWIALMARRVGCDLAASSGVHDGPALIKCVLAGARAVQAASVFYRKGAASAAGMLRAVEEWMDRHGYRTLADFRGRMSQAESEDPAVFERVQFMRHYGSD